jgi:hypothetical protein
MDSPSDPIVLDDQVVMSENGLGRTKRLIHISSLKIPVTYEAVLDVVPGLHARPPILPASEGPSFPPPPETPYDFIFHIGVAGRGPLRMERLGHKLGYHMKDATGKLASVVRSSPKDFSRRADDPLAAENIERERLGMDIVESGGDSIMRPTRGFGTAYENFPDEISTDIDVTRLVQSLRQSGIEVCYLTLIQVYDTEISNIDDSRYTPPWMLVITSATSYIIVPWPKPSEARNHTRSERTRKFCSCTARLSISHSVQRR